VSEEGGESARKWRVQTFHLELEVLDAASWADRHASAVLKNANIGRYIDGASLISQLSYAFLPLATSAVHVAGLGNKL
jgi:hypothetical protein